MAQKQISRFPPNEKFSGFSGLSGHAPNYDGMTQIILGINQEWLGYNFVRIDHYNCVKIRVGNSLIIFLSKLLVFCELKSK